MLGKIVGGRRIIVALAAFLFAAIFFIIATIEIVRIKSGQRNNLVGMTNSFVTVYADTRTDSAIVPAVFRRAGIEHFSNATRKSDELANSDTTIRMSGTPRLELKTIESDPRLRSLINAMALYKSSDTLEEHRWENGRAIGRTMYPSIATSETCVSCHNEALGVDAYKMGDVMGAYVVESDLTAATMRNIGLSFGAFFVAFAVCALIARRENRRMQLVVDGLETKVVLEREKGEAVAYANFLASHDSLTGLANRAMFIDQLKTDLKSSDTNTITVGILDIDDFKTINDTLGHDAGDTVLLQMAERLNTIVGSYGGLAARLGGDEFAFVIKSGPRPDIESIGKTLSQALRVPVDHNNLVINPSGSIGLAMSKDIDDLNEATILKAADASLYSAKKAGKNGYSIFDKAIRIEMVRRAELARNMALAIKRRDISAVFQPKVDIETRRIVGFEALARWCHGGETISPMEFIPVAEESGMIRDLDLAVLRDAAEFSAKIERETGVKLGFSSNFSALSFQREGLGEAIIETLNEAGIPPSRYTLEVTETILVKNWSAISQVLDPLQAQGVCIALDDFGTGYSSLGYLRCFTFDEIKIDRGFISDLAENAQTRFLFKSIVDMARGLNKDITVEGIETEDQAAIVAQHGSMTCQGYLFARPLTQEQARKRVIQDLEAEAYRIAS